MTQPMPISGVVALVVLAAGYGAFVWFELRRWRELGSFLGSRQKVLRGASMALGGLVLALVAALGLDLLPAEPRALRLWSLLAVPVLLCVVGVLVLLDLREIAARRRDHEMALWAEGARVVLDGAKRRAARRGTRRG